MNRRNAYFGASSFVLTIITVMNIACSNCASIKGDKSKQSLDFEQAKLKSDTLSVIIIPSIDNTWGYQILINEKPFIFQSSIPGLPGNTGFSNQKDAEKVANLVVAKIRRGEMPPTITIEELKELNVL
ncbi:MAG: DUF4907 domain-containing protein [Tenuifilaceae bacterium]|jgi:hypothetical protein|nr:DUF4907 domain-containing protein [Tenuifilaceae bacterium]